MRNAQCSDAEQIESLELQLFPTQCLDATTIRRQLSEGRSLVVEREGKIVGYAIVCQRAGIADLVKLAVTPAWQRQGFGRDMLGTLLRHNKDVVLCVAKNNHGALKLYLEMGFTIIGEVKNSWSMLRAFSLRITPRTGGT